LSLEVLEKFLCGFLSGGGFFFGFFTGGLGALGVLGEEFGKLLHRLVIIHFPDGRKLTGHAEQGLFKQLAFRIGLLGLAVGAVEIAHTDFGGDIVIEAPAGAVELGPLQGLGGN
jgi:hypothetical protein